ncbi:MAG TPA: peptidase dimerization domain-containing protein, partial [Atopobiaceae bacterium]|nr:peptidase dimerization domain-containing protein [Atopobiaceae bacterium]
AIEANPMPLRISEPVRQMFDTLGRHTMPLYRMLFANIEAFTPMLDMLTRKTGGNLNALLRTTVAFTQMQGSSAYNVIPSTASVVSNIRINPDDTVSGVLAHLRITIDDPDVTIAVLDACEPSPVSRTDCEGYRRVAQAVGDTWPDCVVSPYVMVQCSDSRHYRDLSDRVYRFSAYDVTADELATVHGNNERIRVETLHRSIEFFTRVLRQC